MEPVSHSESVKEGNFRFHDDLLLGDVRCVYFASHRGNSNKTRWQVQD